MIEDIFLTYANNSLKGNPENLHKIFQVVGENIEIDLEDVHKAIEIICELSQYDNPEDFISVLDEKYDFGGFHSSIEHPARYAVVGDRDSYYFQRVRFAGDKKMKEFLEKSRKRTFDCRLRKVNEKLLGKDRCEDGFIQKCYECHQLWFISVLQDIINGKEYSAIEDIDIMLYESSKISSRRTFRYIEKSNQNSQFKDILITKDFHDLGYLKYMYSEEANCYHPFSEYLNCIAFFSLTEFILHGDRRRIKYCDECKKFYVSKTIRPSRFCSDECRLAWNNRKRIESGEAREYKRKKRAEGAKESYYG